MLSPPRPISPMTSDKLSSPRPQSPSAAQPRSTQSTNNSKPSTRNLIDMIEAPFPSFDCNSAVVYPFQDETARDEAFQKALNEMLLDAALETHAWASARPVHETDTATEKYEKQIMDVQQLESEQGMSAQPLNSPSFFSLVSGRRIFCL
ncbi:hypothetical protein B0H16DRAFT_1488960 [Mycena metata]|uniref:Uncharacterized protein n=1 Tax=Mycena metata TaxID=1033252 RepID=A0AAD7KJ48_9AGAR|nr:hypothetical protein B0H16DRAFT_1488960 [Mycena metata]